MSQRSVGRPLGSLGWRELQVIAARLVPDMVSMTSAEDLVKNAAPVITKDSRVRESGGA